MESLEELVKIITLEKINELQNFEIYVNEDYESFNPYSSKIILDHLNE